MRIFSIRAAAFAIACFGSAPMAHAAGLYNMGGFWKVPLTATSAGLGDSQTCAIAGGSLRCWGWNQYGQLGNGGTTDALTPSVPAIATGSITSVVSGYAHSCAVNGGAAQCWGWNGNGRLGNNSTAQSLVPVQVQGLTSGVTNVAAGGYHSCATVSGAAQCWGNNTYGQLGNNSATDSSVPVQVSGLTSGVQAVVTGFYHSCALLTSGSVQCWGYNTNGQLGNNSTSNSLVPVQVSGLTSGVQAIVAGDYHTCAITSAGAMQCWGYNSNGQIGDGSTTDRKVPTAVTGLTSGVTAIAGGGYFSCAIVSGAAKCWGAGAYGQLGNGGTSDSSTPVAVTGLGSGVQSIYAGGYHACAVLTGGSVQCWGKDTNGQLGNNSTTQSSSPVSTYPLY